MFSDRFAIAYFETLVQQHGIRTVIETGTYKGDSTLEFSKRVDRVVTIELNVDFYEGARPRLSACHNIESLRGNSARLIPSLVGLPERLCFFLDAHWYDYWPLLDELHAIARLRRDGMIKTPVILIDDFKVPDHPEFAFDSYRGQDLDWDYVKEAALSICPRYVVSTNTESEGRMRGILRLEPPAGE